jgi:hypothetical protein
MDMQKTAVTEEKDPLQKELSALGTRMGRVVVAVQIRRRVAMKMVSISQKEQYSRIDLYFVNIKILNTWVLFL